MTTKYPITPKWDGGSQLNSRWRMHKPRLWLNGMATNGPAPSADKVLLRWGVDPVARFSSLWDWGHLTSETSGRSAGFVLQIKFTWVWDGVGRGNVKWGLLIPSRLINHHCPKKKSNLKTGGPLRLINRWAYPRLINHQCWNPFFYPTFFISNSIYFQLVFTFFFIIIVILQV